MNNYDKQPFVKEGFRGTRPDCYSRVTQIQRQSFGMNTFSCQYSQLTSVSRLPYSEKMKHSYQILILRQHFWERKVEYSQNTLFVIKSQPICINPPQFDLSAGYLFSFYYQQSQMKTNFCLAAIDNLIHFYVLILCEATQLLRTGPSVPQ